MRAAQRRRVLVTGTVQGVGFRPFVYRHAMALGLAGHVANGRAGVEIEVEGPADALDALCRRLRDDAPPLARVERVVCTPLPATGADGGFRIAASRDAGAPAVAVSPDVATCADCLAEVRDPAERRHRYPFTNCTNCGPRYTIIRSVPYDRDATTMSVFGLCDACRRDYEDPLDRRFHAEPVACPACGPRLHLVDPSGAVLAAGDAAVDAAVDALGGGRIAAVKGVGGYHLVVDATAPAAVAELRRRKARDDKPFALMVADVDAARTLCVLDAAAEAALVSPRRPIVIAPCRPGGSVADGVAPGLADLGVMLPYTPLHHLLLDRLDRPLVVTSGNRSDEPIAHDDGDALARLGPLVDVVLGHDRAIHVRCDDSVVRAMPGEGVQVLRRSRGYAPEPIALPVPAPGPVLAVGAGLKSTVSVARGSSVVTSHHIGDLDHPAAHAAFVHAVRHLCELTGTVPEVVAHDLHPDLRSSAFAADLDLPTLAVQHHHAHVASCLVDHGRRDRVLGVAFDGFGLGDDGTAWGGEVLAADLAGYERVGHLLPVALPGGDRAAREPWRMAVVWARAALGEAAAARVGAALDGRWEAVLDLARQPATVRTTSVGRLFDAAAALVGLHPRVTYEGQAAMALEAAAASVPPPVSAPWPVDVTEPSDGRAVLDPRPLVARLLAERDAGTPVPVLAAGFHAGLAAGVARLVTALAGAHGLRTVALTGGVFQNARLTTDVAPRLRAAGLEVLVHRAVPANDGGISIGQAAVAAARWAAP